MVAAATIVATGAAGCFGSSTGNAGGGGQCTVNADCGGGGKVCVSGICKMPGAAAMGERCTATRDCAAGLYCDATGYCAAGGTADTGARCATDATCKPPLRCALDGFYGACAAGGTGEAGSTCAATSECLAPLWCGKNHTCAPLPDAFPPYVGAACADEGAFRAYFEVPRPGKPPADFFRLPFPNDVRVTAGKLDISDFPKPGPTPAGVDLVQLYADTWTADFDGFSAVGAVSFRFSNELDFSTVTGTSVLFHDVTPGPATGGLLGRGWSYSTGRGHFACKNRLVVRNYAGDPLLPNHTYAVILTTAIKSTRGETAAPDADLAVALGADRPADAALAHAWDVFAPLRAWMTAQGSMAPAVASAAVFTVADAPGHMERLATAVAALPPPRLTALTLCAAGVTSPCDDGTPARACGAANPAFHELHGKLSVAVYQSGTAPYEAPAQGGGIAAGAGPPAVARMEDVCFALSIPKTPATAPASGWPLTVFHHGTGGSMRSFIDDGVAEKMAGLATPGAVLGFDAVEHGARRGASTKKPDDLVFNPLNPRAARDNFLQGGADILQALRVASVRVEAADSPLTGVAIAFNPAAVSFFGHSQGSTSGELALAFSGAAPAAVLSGAGAFLTRSLLDKTSPQNIAAGMAFLLGEPLDAEHPMMTIFQSFFERSDPIVYNPLLVLAPPDGVPSKHLLMTWGTGDTYTPRSTLEANAQSLGLPPLGTVLQDYGVAAVARPLALNLTGGDGVKRTGVVVQYQTGAGYDGHFVAQRNPAAVADWTAFLQTYLASGTPSLP